MKKSYTFAEEIVIDYHMTKVQLDGETEEEFFIRVDNIKRKIAKEIEGIVSNFGQVQNIESTTEEIYDEEDEIIHKLKRATTKKQ